MNGVAISASPPARDKTRTVPQVSSKGSGLDNGLGDSAIHRYLPPPAFRAFFRENVHMNTTIVYAVDTKKQR